MGLTTFQGLVLKKMEALSPSNQSAMVRFAQLLFERQAKKAQNKKTRSQTDGTEIRPKLKLQKSSSALLQAIPPLSSPGSVPTQERLNDNEWLFSKNRRRDAAVPRSTPSGQKWASNRWNHSGK